MNKVDQDHYFFEKRNTKEINLKDFFDVIKKRLWIIVLVTVIATLAGYFFSKWNETLLYQTSTRIIIDSDSQYMNTLMVMIKDPIIMEKVKDKLDLSRTSESIANQIEVERIDESQVIRISVVDQDPKVAVEIANETAKTFKGEIVNLLEFEDVQLLSEAKENPHPINENDNRTIIIAFVFGLITGIGLVFLLDSIDGTVKKDIDVEEILNAPVLGAISNMNKKKLVMNRRLKKDMEYRGETIEVK